MEAAAMGVPSVASNVKGNREAVVDGETGILVPFGEPTTLAAAITPLLRDSAAVNRLGSAARQRALAEFDERLVFQKVLAEYARLQRDLRSLPAGIGPRCQV